MLRRDAPSTPTKVDLPDGEHELAHLDDATVEGIGEGRFSVTNRHVRFFASPSVASRALHGFAASSAGRGGEATTLRRDEIASISIESTMLGFKKLRLHLTDGSAWIVQIGARDPSDLAMALRTTTAR